MGIFNFLEKVFMQESQENDETYLELRESIIFDLAKMKQKILTMHLYYPEKA
ncbi:MAG: hypothetical protein HFJ33_00695 [Clostridia bacterium]|nr:hypothetical protein [Clostridia bacterium]